MSITRHIEEKYVGRPYDKDAFNCFTLIRYIYADLGHVVNDVNVGALDLRWSYNGKNYFLENHSTQWEKIDLPKTFDVVMLKNFLGVAHHAGVMLDECRFIHCATSGVEIRRITERSINRKLYGFFRFKAIAHD